MGSPPGSVTMEDVLRELMASSKGATPTKSAPLEPWSRTVIHPAQRLTLRKRRIRRRAFVAVALLALGILASAGAFWYLQDGSWRPVAAGNGASLRAVLIDELSGTVPDPHFINETISTLGSAGYHVDYISSPDVTVRFFQKLPSQSYSIVIIRAHSGTSAIYTSEPYSTSNYLYEQLSDRVGEALLDGKLYFTITPKFVQEGMSGRFPGSLIVTMGCSGLSDSDMARAFMDRGAGAYIGWNSAVSPMLTDRAVGSLVHALAQGRSAREAVDFSMAQLGTASYQPARLIYYDSTITPKQQTILEFSGLVATVSILLVTISGPVAVMLIPRLI